MQLFWEIILNHAIQPLARNDGDFSCRLNRQLLLARVCGPAIRRSQRYCGQTLAALSDVDRIAHLHLCQTGGRPSLPPSPLTLQSPSVILHQRHDGTHSRGGLHPHNARHTPDIIAAVVCRCYLPPNPMGCDVLEIGRQAFQRLANRRRDLG